MAAVLTSEIVVKHQY